MLGIALATASFVLQAGQAVAAHSAQEKAKKENKRAALDAARRSTADLEARSTEERIAAAQQMLQIQRQSRQAGALARLSAGEAGVTGNSLAAQAATIQRDELTASGVVRSNLERTLAQIGRMKAGELSQTQSRINAVPGANPFATAIQIGSAGLDFLNTFNRNKPPAT